MRRDNKLGQVTERTFYQPLLEIISEMGGTGAQEIQFDTVPDIVFFFKGVQWFMSVKIGESKRILKDSFIQYLKHKADSGLNHGILLYLPDSVRKIRITENLKEKLEVCPVGCIIDAAGYQDEFRNIPISEIFKKLDKEVMPLLAKGISKAYPLSLVISLLQAQLEEVMEGLSLRDVDILKIVTDRKLLTDIGSLDRSLIEEVATFLGSYIILSQILFLRNFAVEHPDILQGCLPITTFTLRTAFKKILEINYRPIFEIDVLDSVSEKYLKDTFDLIWGLEIEKSRYELPGRIFHALMPTKIRKLLAAFYTRPVAADILARLCINSSDEMVFDLACGSGTILTAAYKEKLRRFREERRAGNPHKRFCEEEIFGADIMPFAVHLTAANLASMDVSITIDRTQIVEADSLQLQAGSSTREGQWQSALFHIRRPVVGSEHDYIHHDAPQEALDASGERYQLNLRPVDVILMNPPFTKVERGIRDYVDMERFQDFAGREVGLWGHFIGLANNFLKEGGIMGAVLPINILRGRESARVRDFIFDNWEPLYILKPVFNYGFSERAEYRDIILVCRKSNPERKSPVKFCLIKKDLNSLSEDDVAEICEKIGQKTKLRSAHIDIDSHSREELNKHRMNLMWFIGVNDLKHRDCLITFIDKVNERLDPFPAHYFREGYRPVPKGVSEFMFITRSDEEPRAAQAFLRFYSNSETNSEVIASTILGTQYHIEKSSLRKTLRTGISLMTMDATRNLDYISFKPYVRLDKVRRACGFNRRLPSSFWNNVNRELNDIETNIVVIRRINPYSPNSHLISFYSKLTFSPSNQLTVIKESDKITAKAVCALLNSIIFLSQFFMSKEETTGRYVDIRFYDLYEMKLFPKVNQRQGLSNVFNKFKDVRFPSLREQLDKNFNERYEEFWEMSNNRASQQRLWDRLKEPIEPFDKRIEFDLSVCDAIGVRISERDLTSIYEILVREMIITRRLTKD